MSTTVRLFATAAVLTAAVACGQAPTATGDLDAALLRQEDVPARYSAVAPEAADRPVMSSRPECAATFDRVEVDPPADPAVREARTLFGSPDGERIQHIVRSYPNGAATTEFAAVTGTLATCSRFELTYADGTAIVVEVQPLPAPEAADEAWTAHISLDAGAFTLGEQLVLVRAGERIATLSILGIDEVDPDEVSALTTRAAERLVGA